MAAGFHNAGDEGRIDHSAFGNGQRALARTLRRRAVLYADAEAATSTAADLLVCFLREGGYAADKPSASCRAAQRAIGAVLQGSARGESDAGGGMALLLVPRGVRLQKKAADLLQLLFLLFDWRPHGGGSGERAAHGAEGPCLAAGRSELLGESHVAEFAAGLGEALLAFAQGGVFEASPREKSPSERGAAEAVVAQTPPRASPSSASPTPAPVPASPGLDRSPASIAPTSGAPTPLHGCPVDAGRPRPSATGVGTVLGRMRLLVAAASHYLAFHLPPKAFAPGNAAAESALLGSRLEAALSGGRGGEEAAADLEDSFEAMRRVDEVDVDYLQAVCRVAQASVRSSDGES